MNNLQMADMLDRVATLCEEWSWDAGSDEEVAALVAHLAAKGYTAEVVDGEHRLDGAVRFLCKGWTVLLDGGYYSAAHPTYPLVTLELV